MAETDSREPRGRTIAFRIVAGLLGLATVVLSVPFAVGSLTDEQEKIHAFHNIGAGMASGIVFGVGLLLAAWKPWEMIAPFQVTFLASILIAFAGMLGGDLISGSYFIGLLVAVILIALHPARADLWRLGRVRPSLLVLWVVWSVPAFAYASTQANLQRTSPAVDPHADLHHYSNAAAAVVGVVAAALVAALGTRGTRAAAWLAGVAGALLGVVSLAFAERVSVFDATWAWLAIVWAIAFVVASELEFRRDAPA